MLLVDNDQAHPLERREHRRARADHDVHLPAPDPLPLVVAFPVGETAVQDRDLRAECLAEERGGGRGQGDLRHQHQHPPARVANRSGEPDIELGLAAPGHAVHQRDPKHLFVGETTQPIERQRLFAGQPPAWLAG